MWSRVGKFNRLIILYINNLFINLQTFTIMADTTSFLNKGYQSNYDWKEVSSQKLSKEDLENISEIRIANSRYGLQMVFFMKQGGTIKHNLSKFCEQFDPGTKIRPSSVSISEVYDSSENRTVYKASGERL